MKKYAGFIIFIVLVACLLAGCQMVTGLSFKEDTFTVGIGKEITPDVIIKPASGDYTLSVSNETIASVDGRTVKGLKTGIATLRATAGDKVAEATLIVSDLAEPGGITFVPTHSYYVTFSIVNYSEVGLGSSVLENQLYAEGETMSRQLPMYTGYEVRGWFLDTLCTEEFDAEANPIVANLNLYCKAYAKSNSITVDSEGYITGFMYRNLPHSSELSLPESVSGMKIKGIAGKAFQGDKYIKTVKIPASYEVIGNFAFSGCSELTTVEIAQGSILNYIGRFAFSYSAEEVSSEDDTDSDSDSEEETEPEIVPGGSACVKLASINLPDTLSEIGSFAFYDCSGLKKIKLPAALKTIQYGAFSGTQITDIDLINVTEIQAFAFKDCTSLYSVRNTEGVISCGANAFYGTVLHNKIKATPFVAYAGTILFACNDLYGKTVGGKLELPDDVTLIADGTFKGSGQSELTLYVKKSGVIFGDNVFKTSSGVCIAVENQDMYNEYRDAMLRSDNAEYVPLLCIREEYVIDDNINAVNFGKHIVLRFPITGTVYYDKFEVGTFMLDGVEMKKSPEVIDMTALPCANKITRINTRAINLGENGGNLKRLVLPRYLNEIAFLAIVNCYVLTDIDCMACNEAPTVVPNSIQFTTVGRDPSKGGKTLARVYVPKGNYEHYRSRWENSGDIYDLIEIKTED